MEKLFFIGFIVFIMSINTVKGQQQQTFLEERLQTTLKDDSTDMQKRMMI